MSPEQSILLFVSAILLGIALNIVAQVLARRTYVITVPLAPEEANRRLLAAFGRMTWAEGSGPGSINKRRRHVSDRMSYTLSADVGAVPGGSEITLWLSGAMSNLGGLALLNALGPSWQLGRLRRLLVNGPKHTERGEQSTDALNRSA